MKRIFFFGFCLLILVMAGNSGAQTAPGSAAATTTDGLEVEKLKLEIERLKLENQRLQLQIKTMQVESDTDGSTTDKSAGDSSPSKTAAAKEEKKVIKILASKVADLAKENAKEEHKVVLDFNRGEIWYKGVHYKLNDFRGLCSDQNWELKPQFLKYDVGGDSLSRFRYRNMYLDRYAMQSTGVFVIEKPASGENFSFITPESLTETSAFGDFRNGVGAPYFIFDREEKDKGTRMLRFKHGAGFLGYDDVLEVYFDTEDHFTKFRWGLLDKK